MPSVVQIVFDNINADTVVDTAADSNFKIFTTINNFSYTVYGKADGKSSTKVGNSQNYVTAAGESKVAGKCINFQGSASLTDTIKSCIEFVAPNSATKVTVQFYNGNADRSIKLLDGSTAKDGIVKTPAKATGSDGKTYPVLTSESFTITGGNTIRLGGSGGVYILSLKIE